MRLEYLIVYENDGTPIYSRCFGNLCKIAMKDDVLFAAFLSSLVTFASYDEANIDEIEIEGMKVQVEYKQDDHLMTLILEDMKLIFVYSKTANFTIAAGFDLKSYEKDAKQKEIDNFFSAVDNFVVNHSEIDWKNLELIELLNFEAELLRVVIHPFFSAHSIKDKCPFGDNCPMRLAMIEEKHGSIFDRLRAKTKEYKEMNMLKMMWRMMTRSKYKASN